MKNYLLQISHQPDCSGKLILNLQEANKDLSVDRPVKGSAFFKWYLPAIQSQTEETCQQSLDL